MSGLWNEILIGVINLQLNQIIMFAVGGLLIYLAIAKEYEPMLLLPIGFGAILANIPLSSAIGDEGFLTILYNIEHFQALFYTVRFLLQ